MASAWDPILSEFGGFEYRFTDSPKHEEDAYSRGLALCKENRCGCYGLTWGCPPGAPGKDEVKEILSRYEILLENYAKTIHIESLTLQEMVRKDFTAGLVRYMKDITNEALKKKELLPDSLCSYENRILQKLDETSEQIITALDILEADTLKAEKIGDILEQAAYYQETILSEMETLRSWTDQAEAIIPDEYLPYPTYEQMLFSLR